MSKAGTAPSAIFVVGTGRSGTHFACRVLLEFAATEDFLSGKEHSATLKNVAIAAMRETQMSRATRLRYLSLKLRAKVKGRVLVDQHHPNLFHIADLLKTFPDAVFIYPQRPAVQVVASMLRHRGVKEWYAKIQSGQLNVPFPNRFFGLDTMADITRLPPHMLCLARINAHQAAANAARALWPQQVRFLDYEVLVADRDAALAQVFSAEELARLGPVSRKEDSTPQSLTKYLDVLTPEQIVDIEAAQIT